MWAKGVCVCVTGIDGAAIGAVLQLWLQHVGVADGLGLPLLILLVAVLVLAAAAVVLELLPQDLIIQRRHDYRSPGTRRKCVE